MTQTPITILLAEDDSDDRYLISEALDESDVESQLYIVENGEELLDYLRHQGKFADTNKYPRPELILLDLNMPLMDGREALAQIKKDPDLNKIPVIVLTTSQAGEDIQKTYGLGITGFISKPMSFSGLVEIMQSIGDYWCRSVTLPSREGIQNE